MTLPRISIERGALLRAASSGGPGSEEFVVDHDTCALVVPIAPSVADRDDSDFAVQPRTGTADAAALYAIDLAEVADRESLTGAAGETFVLTIPAPMGSSGQDSPWRHLPSRIILAGVGDESATALRRTGAAIANATRGYGKVVTTVAADASAEVVRAFAEGYLLGAYRQPYFGSKMQGKRPAEDLVLLGRYNSSSVESAQTAAASTWIVRDLANTPSNIKNPQWMVERVQELAKSATGDLGRGGRIDVAIWDEKRLAADGFGGILAVGSGSDTPPRLAVVSYVPTALPGRDQKHVVVVGKGITFDTGGISIKPREAMVPMKTDMAGAAVAFATVIGAARAGLKHRVTAVMPLAENAFGGNSYRPADVLTAYNGTTIEIGDTDAEGRIVLADGLSYADAELDPDILIDVATLTGAATLGLGKRHSAMYTADDKLADAFTAAGEASGELVWRMPLVEEYRFALDSTIADISHISKAKKLGGGSITAALFLREFVGQRRWVHFDIAGPGRAPKNEHWVTEGATGYGARLLLRWLEGLR